MGLANVFIHCIFTEPRTARNHASKKQSEKKCQNKMSIFDSSEFYKLFLVATSLFVLIGSIHHVLSLSPYPPIFGVYRQKSFAFYVKKYLMRILLKYRKRAPIGDADADKLQPLSSHPLVSDGSQFHFDSSEIKMHLCEHCRHLTPFISIRALRMGKS